MTLTITLEDEIEKEGELLIHAPNLSDAGFYEFCRSNPLLPIERTKEKDILVMAPADDFTDSRNAEAIGDLVIWNRSLDTPGKVSGATAGFTFPNGAVRSPDAAWTSADRWNTTPTSLRSPAIPFSHTVPDLVIEIMSPSDRLPKAREKMDEYIENGVLLGWLVDRANRTVYVYRPNIPMEMLRDPVEVCGDPELPGLVINMARVFQDTL